MAIYQDGELFASANNSRAYVRQPGAGLTIAATRKFRGLIDEFGIFNRRLSQEESHIIMTPGLASKLAVEPTTKLASAWG